MNKLRAALSTILKTIHPRVYFMNSPTDEVFPYIVYGLPQSYADEDLEVFSLDIDIWDAPVDGDTTALETLSQSIWNELNRYYFIDKDIQFTVYRVNRSAIEDDDPRLKRRTLIFNIRFHDRSVN